MVRATRPKYNQEIGFTSIGIRGEPISTWTSERRKAFAVLQKELKRLLPSSIADKAIPEILQVTKILIVDLDDIAALPTKAEQRAAWNDLVTKIDAILLLLTGPGHDIESGNATPEALDRRSYQMLREAHFLRTQKLFSEIIPELSELRETASKLLATPVKSGRKKIGIGPEIAMGRNIASLFIRYSLPVKTSLNKKHNGTTSASLFITILELILETAGQSKTKAKRIALDACKYLGTKTSPK